MYRWTYMKYTTFDDPLTGLSW